MKMIPLILREVSKFNGAWINGAWSNGAWIKGAWSNGAWMNESSQSLATGILDTYRLRKPTM